MLGDLISWYLTSLAEFWGSAIRIGLPQILLVILLICWLRRKGCGKSRERACCWMWSCGRSGDREESDCREPSADYGCRGNDRAREAGGDDEDE